MLSDVVILAVGARIPNKKYEQMQAEERLAAEQVSATPTTTITRIAAGDNATLMKSLGGN